MKLITHIITGLSGALLVSFIVNGYKVFLGSISIIMIMSLIHNGIIDYLGHYRRGKIFYRNAITHEVLNNIYLSILVGAFIFIAFGSVYKVHLVETIIYSITIGAIHLFTDLLTSAGIYVRGRSSIYRVKFRFSRRYDDPYLNGLAIAISGVLILYIINSSIASNSLNIDDILNLSNTLIEIYNPQ